jgi:hypothetical protein
MGGMLFQHVYCLSISATILTNGTLEFRYQKMSVMNSSYWAQVPKHTWRRIPMVTKKRSPSMCEWMKMTHAIHKAGFQSPLLDNELSSCPHVVLHS